jgi:Ca-activated chloride channel family protein
MTGSFELRCTVNRKHIEAGKPAIVFAAFDVRPGAARPEADAPVLNVGLAIDTSQSMKGPKIEQARAAATALVGQLRPEDWVSLVSFDTRAKRVLKATPVRKSGAIMKAIRALDAGGSTDMYRGLEVALKALRKARKEKSEVTRLLLITDGNPQVGRTDAGSFQTIAGEARADGITITTLGIGSDYNAGLLTQVAQAGGGLWYHVRDPTRDLTSLLRAEMGHMSNTLVQAPKLSISLEEGSDLLQAYSVRPMVAELPLSGKRGSMLEVPISDLIAGQEQNYVLRIRLPARPAGEIEAVSGRVGAVQRAARVTRTPDASLYAVEADPYPRLLLTTTEGTVALRRGVEAGDSTALARAGIIIRTVMADPSLPATGGNQGLVGEMATRLYDSQQIVQRGNLTAEAKQQITYETTIIGKRPDPK